jgi:hypothetical protein
MYFHQQNINIFLISNLKNKDLQILIWLSGVVCSMRNRLFASIYSRLKVWMVSISPPQYFFWLTVTLRKAAWPLNLTDPTIWSPASWLDPMRWGGGWQRGTVNISANSIFKNVWKISWYSPINVAEIWTYLQLFMAPFNNSAELYSVDIWSKYMFQNNYSVIVWYILRFQLQQLTRSNTVITYCIVKAG